MTSSRLEIGIMHFLFSIYLIFGFYFHFLNLDQETRLITLLLFLLPPTCMVVPIREVANKQFSLVSAISYYSTMSQFPSNMEMNVVSNSIMRERSNLSNKASSRSSSVFSSTSFVLYYKHIEVDNNKPKEDIREPIDSSQLSYKDIANKGESISEVTDIFLADGKQHVSNKALALKNVP